MGLNLDQLKELDPNIVQENEYTFTISPPSPHNMFSRFIVKVHPSYGVFKIIAISSEIDTDIYGSKLKSTFNEISKGLSNKYDNPSNTFDFLRVGSIWNEPRDFMMALLKKEYVLATYWSAKDGMIIGIECIALSNNCGVIVLSYDSKDIDAAIKDINLKRDSSF